MKKNKDGSIKVSSIPNELHFHTQLTTRMQIQKNRKKYTRKIKHKKKELD